MDRQLMKLTELRRETLEAENVPIRELLEDTAARLREQADRITVAVRGEGSVIPGPQLIHEALRSAGGIFIINNLTKSHSFIIKITSFKIIIITILIINNWFIHI